MYDLAFASFAGFMFMMSETVQPNSGQYILKEDLRYQAGWRLI